MTGDRITRRARQRMKLVLRRRAEGKSLEQVGRELKVTRERIRQIQKIGEHLRNLGRL